MTASRCPGRRASAGPHAVTFSGGRRRRLYALGIPFTAGQVVDRAAQDMPGVEIATFDEPIQVLSVLVLVSLYPEGDELTTGM